MIRQRVTAGKKPADGKPALARELRSEAQRLKLAHASGIFYGAKYDILNTAALLRTAARRVR